MKHQVDTYVGKRIRFRRWGVGVTQGNLAEKVGVKFQQIQKYETGANRVSASRLWDIANVLKVPVSFFFEGLANASVDSAESDFTANKEVIELVRRLNILPEAQRNNLIDLIRSMAATEE